MGKFGEAAIRATQFLEGNESMPPQVAWASAVEGVFPHSPSSQKKGCPRNAFLAICGMGALRNLTSGCYTRSIKNRGYVERALAAIRLDPKLATDEKALWLIATEGITKVENSQMDVLTTLFLKGHIE